MSTRYLPASSANAGTIQTGRLLSNIFKEGRYGTVVRASGSDQRRRCRGVRGELEPILIPEEEIELAFQVVRDLFVFTDLRLIIVDKQGVTGRKRQIQSLPYRSITMFAIETAGHFDVDSELTLWITGQPPLIRQLSRRSDITGIQKALAHGVLGRRPAA